MLISISQADILSTDQSFIASLDQFPAISLDQVVPVLSLVLQVLISPSDDADHDGCQATQSQLAQPLNFRVLGP
eukprot:4885937-Amphidinium_carterae.1